MRRVQRQDALVTLPRLASPPLHICDRALLEVLIVRTIWFRSSRGSPHIAHRIRSSCAALLLLQVSVRNEVSRAAVGSRLRALTVSCTRCERGDGAEEVCGEGLQGREACRDDADIHFDLLPDVVPCAFAGEIGLVEEVILEGNFVHGRCARTVDLLAICSVVCVL